ncbi:MAG TPA: hypothetical protein VLH77_05715, partial [Gammaproteobacteria bacterium]|nr:hypothetical protein [Gammaproteobacteria bacterium]
TAPTEVVKAVVSLTAFIPVVQCILLLLLPKSSDETRPSKSISLYSAVFTCARHFSTLMGEQLFQVLARTTFFNFGAGYLSAYALAIRIYSALRFILIDSYIAAKLGLWKKEGQTKDYLFKIVNSLSFSFFLVLVALGLGLARRNGFGSTMFQLVVILALGFYLSTVVRIIYFKMNHADTQSSLVWRFTLSELFFAFLAFILTIILKYPILALIWLGYVAKPFSQLLILRKPFLTKVLASV